MANYPMLSRLFYQKRSKKSPKVVETSTIKVAIPGHKHFRDKNSNRYTIYILKQLITFINILPRSHICLHSATSDYYRSYVFDMCKTTHDSFTSLSTHWNNFRSITILSTCWYLILLSACLKKLLTLHSK